MKDKKIFEQLKQEHPIDELVKYDELNISEEIQKNPGLIVKYRDLYHMSLAELDELETLMEKLMGKRYEHYRFHTDEGWTKVEIEKYCLPQDEKIVRMKNIIARQKVKTRFFEMCWKAFESRQWSMKLFMETLKGY